MNHGELLSSVFLNSQNGVGYGQDWIDLLVGSRWKPNAFVVGRPDASNVNLFVAGESLIHVLRAGVQRSWEKQWKIVVELNDSDFTRRSRKE